MSLIPKAEPKIKYQEELKHDILKEYEKTIFLLQFLVIDEREMQGRLKDNEFGVTVSDIC